MSNNTVAPGAERPQPKKAVSFWSHFGNHEAIRREFPEISCMGMNFKHGLPAVELWTLHILPNEEADYRARFFKFVYNFEEDEPEILIALRELLGEVIEAISKEDTVVRLKSLIDREERKVTRKLLK